MDKINKIINREGKYNKLQKPLEAAHVCDIARLVADGRFEVVSFRQGLLTLATPSSAEAANLQLESQQIIDSINKKIGKEAVENLRFRIKN